MLVGVSRCSGPSAFFLTPSTCQSIASAARICPDPEHSGRIADAHQRVWMLWAQRLLSRLQRSSVHCLSVHCLRCLVFALILSTEARARTLFDFRKDIYCTFPTTRSLSPFLPLVTVPNPPSSSRIFLLLLHISVALTAHYGYPTPSVELSLAHQSWQRLSLARTRYRSFVQPRYPQGHSGL
jgi:hypothetical protein